MAKTKAAYKQYWNELREKWIAFDPIGVMDDPDWPRDEYDTYVGQTLNLLAQGAALERHVRHLEQVIEGMGIELDRRKLELQAAEFIAWCEKRSDAGEV
ncbi:MAG: hypothetical protein JJ900_16885 [Rhodospirillales bacterium]|nr:hypothetical protein [Rhodospirillales bacterium]MBO6788525.1 hypothetical protein [Rhodospirillales bacterium]